MKRLIWLLLIVTLWFVTPSPAQTWDKWNGTTVGASSTNLSSWNGTTIGTSSGNIGAWNGLTSPGGGGPTYAITRDANGSSAFANTFDVTISPAVGELITVALSNPDVFFTPNVTDDAGTPNTYTQQATAANFPDNYRVWIFTSKITHAGATKITITGSNAGQNTIAYITGFTGITSATIVGTACSDAHPSGTALSCTLSSLPGSAPYFIYGYAFSFGQTTKPGTGMSGGQVAWSAGSTCPGPSGTTFACPLYKTLSSGNGTTVDATAVSGDYIIVGLALQ